MKLSVILINYNSSAFTLRCVASIRGQTRLSDYELIIVDNNSQPDDFARLQPLASDPVVKLIHSRLNLGFAGGNMLGVQAASPNSAYHFFLNNDCLLLTDVGSRLYEYMEQHPNVGVCVPQMYNEAGERQHSFSYFPTLGVKLLGHGIMRVFRPAAYPPLKTAYEAPVQVPVVSGSAMFVRASAFAEVGGLDTVYFLYCEEEDLCKRLAQKGYSAVLVPDARYMHYSGGSTRRNLNIEKEYYISLFHYYRKYHGWPARQLLRLFFFLKNIRKLSRDAMYGQLAFFILRGSPVGHSLRYKQTITRHPDELSPSVVSP
ncbi:glycosyltransferase family 2 protein [Nibrella viscosa]|uniref:Glycosyltransferase family 2 protein n=1 Tax=Nibrella viscosa TaxID=1084524 RepID=A0ABP8K0U7_9BACT